MYIYTKEMSEFIHSNFCPGVTRLVKSFYNVNLHALLLITDSSIVGRECNDVPVV